jgi:hypothetical protein
MQNLSRIAPARRSNLTLSRRGLLSLAGASAAALGAFSLTSAAPDRADQRRVGQDFPKSDGVDHRKVTFKNRYGITLVGDLYLPKNRSDRRLPRVKAVAVGTMYDSLG